MTIQEALVAHLTGDGDVSQLVHGRVYPDVLPQKPGYPSIVYHTIASPREHSQQGPSGLAFTRIQIDCIDGTARGARELGTAVRLALDGFAGTMGGGGGVAVGSVFVEDEDGDYDDTLRLFRWRLDVVISHEE